jgi:LysR family glycine cleavage system transcriptional activator
VSEQLPSLNALRAFEAAARLESFSLAADELNVTHAAISHQIRALEEWFGTRLFLRLSGRVELISTCRPFSKFLTKLFEQLESRTQELKALVGKNQLTLKVDPQFAAIWLVPRLANFSKLHPEVELDVITEYGGLDPRKDEATIALQYLDEGESIEQSGVTVECLFAVSAFPVCKPEVLKASPVQVAKDILKHTLLHGEDRDWWRSWLDIADVKTKGPLPGPKFSQSYLALLAAEGGQGIALLDDIEAAESLAAGRLVRVLDMEMPAGEYVIVQNALTPETSVMVTVKEWFRAQL